MVSDRLTTTIDVPLHRAGRELRLKMKPGTAMGGVVDGGWWPWSTDLAAEVPALVMALTSWIGPARHLAYRADDWDATPARALTVDGWTIHLETQQATSPNTVVLTGPDQRRISVLVVPPATPGGVAHAVLRTASDSDTSTTVADMFACNGLPLSG
jgi:hypothetical protein